MSGPVSTGMGDRVRVQFPVLVISHSGQLSLAIPSWVGTMRPAKRVVTPCSWGVKAV